MIDKILALYINTTFIVIAMANKKVPPTWAVRISTFANMGMGLIICGLMLKLVLRMTGLNSGIYMPLTTILTLFILYLIVEKEVLLSADRVAKTRAAHKIAEPISVYRKVFSVIAVILYVPVCVATMILVMKFF